MEQSAVEQEVAEPRNQQELEALINDLYSPNSPRRIFKIQEVLQRMQKSPQGLQYAGLLLDSLDEKARFFGALTVSVQLNCNPSISGDERHEELLLTLLGYSLKYLELQAGSLVIRRLCSTLVDYFLTSSASWTQCVRHLVYCLSAKIVAPYSRLEAAADTTSLLETLGTPELELLLWFCTAAAEMVDRTDINSEIGNQLHSRLRLNVSDVAALISLTLVEDRARQQSNSRISQEAMKCFHAWVIYSYPAVVEGISGFGALKSLTEVAVNSLAKPDLYSPTVDLFRDIFDNYPRFLDPKDKDSFRGLFDTPWANDKLVSLIQGDYEEDSLQFGRLLTSFSTSQRNESSDTIAPLISKMTGLLQAKGHAVEEDLIFVHALEFWTEYYEDLLIYIDELQEPNSYWTDHNRNTLATVVNSLWKKIQYPIPAQFGSWDTDDKAAFLEVRKDVADLFQAICPLASSYVSSTLTSLALESLAAKAWIELEASLYCLGSIADFATDDSILDAIFGSELWSKLADPASEIPLRTKRAALSLILQYDVYFSRTPRLLPVILSACFQGMRDNNLVDISSKSIYSLCNACRQDLVPELLSFFVQYELLLQTHAPHGIAKERIVGSIAMIIQAIKNEEDKLQPLLRLLQLYERDLNQCQALTKTDVESAEVQGTDIIRCLASMARGLQIPDDEPIDLEDANSSLTKSSYWTDSEGTIFQNKVIEIIQWLIGIFPASGEIMQASCDMFHRGIEEKVPGPFVFSSSLVLQFILIAHLKSPRLSTIIGTACGFVSSIGTHSSPQNLDISKRVHLWLFGLVQGLNDPADDPEITQACIDFATRQLARYYPLITSDLGSLFENYLIFSLRVLTGTDSLPKSSSAAFWNEFLARNDDLAKSVMQQLGPQLAQALIYNVSGHAARSELDRIAETIKKLVSRQPGAKSWLEQALSQPGITSDKTTAAEKKTFLNKTIALRGKRETNKVIREYWLACRGSNFAYAS